MKFLGLKALLLAGLFSPVLYANTETHQFAYISSHQQIQSKIRETLGQSSDVKEKYQLEKAQTWLSYANQLYSEKSKPKNLEMVYQQVLKITNTDNRVQLTTQTPILAFAQVMRRDLWTRIESIKVHAGFQCAYKELAQAEVKLVWAAAEYCQLGWHHSREIFASAERLVDQAGYLAQHCENDRYLDQAFSPIKMATVEQLNGSTGCQGVNLAYWPFTPNQ